VPEPDHSTSLFRELAIPPASKLWVADFVEPYLSLILARIKQYDSRIHADQRLPYGAVQAGDWVAVKQAEGGIVAAVEVLATWSLDLDHEADRRQLAAHKSLIMGTSGYWHEKEGKRFCTILKLGTVRTLAQPLTYLMPGGQHWVAV